MDEGWVAWDRDLPLRYLLVCENEDGDEELWAKAAGAEGLFVDRPAAKREVLTLRGCQPAGVLTDAVTAGAATQTSLPYLIVQARDATHMTDRWELTDVSLIAQRPDAADPSLTDIAVGAGIDELCVHGRAPLEPQFKLFDACDRPAGRCLRVDGLYSKRRGARRTPVTLVGCEPSELLMRVLRKPKRWYQGGGQLWALDRAGRVMNERCIGGVEHVRLSVLGGALLDITFADCDDTPPPAARPVWEAWYRGRPRVPNQWAPFPAAGRQEWLDMTYWTLDPDREDVSGGTYHLDGIFVTDEPGLHCAMGEAFNGPGGYFGREWMAFKDCLNGGFGVTPPFTLIWHHADVARQALAGPHGGRDSKPSSYFDDVVALLRRYRASVVLE